MAQWRAWFEQLVPLRALPLVCHILALGLRPRGYFPRHASPSSSTRNPFTFSRTARRCASDLRGAQTKHRSPGRAAMPDIRRLVQPQATVPAAALSKRIRCAAPLDRATMWAAKPHTTSHDYWYSGDPPTSATHPALRLTVRTACFMRNGNLPLASMKSRNSPRIPRTFPPARLRERQASPPQPLRWSPLRRPSTRGLVVHFHLGRPVAGGLS